MLKRLKTIASFVKKGAILLDVGTDHGLLLDLLFKEGKIDKALASDINEMPLSKARAKLKDYNVSFYLTDGLNAIPDIYDTVVLAGMGGLLIEKILMPHLAKLKDKHLILAPNKDSYHLRTFLMNYNFLIAKEALVFENKHYYEVISFRHGVANYSLLELYFGPYLLTHLDVLIIKKLKADLELLKLKSKYDPTYLPLYNDLNKFLSSIGVYA